MKIINLVNRIGDVAENEISIAICKKTRDEIDNNVWFYVIHTIIDDSGGLLKSSVRIDLLNKLNNFKQI